MDDTTQKLKKYKLQYKIFSTLGTIIFVDFILKSTGIPFIANLILYPLLDLFLKQDIAFTILGIYSVSWLFLFIPAIILNRKIKNIEKNGTIIGPQKANL